VCTGELAERLQQDIDRLAAEHEAPSFEPHVTLVGGTEQSEEDALRITADLAQSLQVGHVHHYVCVIAEYSARRQCTHLKAHASRHAQAYRLEFQDVSYGSIFHQCVYVRCKTTDAAMDAAKRTRQAFGHPTDTQYMPHVSLLYSDIPSETRCALCLGLAMLALASERRVCSMLPTHTAGLAHAYL
jgi:2'-5' RNA ligase